MDSNNIYYHYNSDETLIKVEYKVFMQWLKLHRDCDLPSLITYHDNGMVKSEEYYHDGKLHRVGNKNMIAHKLPAVREYYENGRLLFEGYYVKGLNCRNYLKDPSNIWYHPNGVVRRMEWRRDGELWLNWWGNEVMPPVENNYDASTKHYNNETTQKMIDESYTEWMDTHKSVGSSDKDAAARHEKFIIFKNLFDKARIDGKPFEERLMEYEKGN